MSYAQPAAILVLGVVLSSCTLAPVEQSEIEGGPENLYEVYDQVLEQIVPLDLNYGAISFRRYDTYARSHNPPEFVASILIQHTKQGRQLKSGHRVLLDQNLYIQLAEAFDQGAEASQLVQSVRWFDGESSSKECPELVEVWEKARQLQPSSPVELPQFEPVALADDEELMVIRLHARIYEVSFEIDNQTITVRQEGGPSPLSEWVEESIVILELCASK